jgi:tRNA-specific 2-thiouridylase
MLATGHYARLLYGDEGVELHKARDPNKDQTYFLHAVSAGALAETVFPLGDLTKAEVRALARECGLQNHAKKDSTGICFIGERPFREFLANYLPASPGPIQTPDGDTLGEHQGLMYYTIGQRQGLGIGGLRDAGDAPWFVSGKRLHDNVLLVVQGEHPDLYSAALQTGVASWIGEPPGALRRAEPFRCRAKVRYRQPEQRCAVARLAGGRLQVRFDTPQRAVAPGQYVVFYDGDRCLGGAVIERAEALEGPLRAAI